MQALFQNVLVRRFFVVPSFEIYGGVAGLYDLGPSACAIRHHLVDLWRRHFIIAEDMLEIQGTNLVPEAVLQASGHVAKFADFMVKDLKTGECYRADKVIETFVSAKLEADDALAEGRTPPMAAPKGKKGKAPAEPPKRLTAEERQDLQTVLNTCDGAGPEELHEIIQRLGIKSDSGNEFSTPFPFNLMFKTSIGPAGNQTAYLRPETAQCIFMNFRRALEHAKGLPFAIADVGCAFRNEISPRMGLIRVREFEQAEIEHFMANGEGKHKKFRNVENVEVELFTAEEQLAGLPGGKIYKIGDAVRSGVLRHETFGYFIARVFQYLVLIGLDPQRLRFRQHLPKQLAHYARDCWDCDCKLMEGWVEIVGIADRSAYDLEVHSKASGVDMRAFVSYSEPREEEYSLARPVMGLIGKDFKKDGQALRAALEAMPGSEVEALKTKLEAEGQAEVEVIPIAPKAKGKSGDAATAPPAVSPAVSPATSATISPIKLTVLPKHVTFESGKKMVHGESVTPFVVEPSFGIGRILYALLEHSFYVRPEDEKRTVFRFNPQVASVKVAVLPLLTNGLFDETCEYISAKLRDAGISTKVDDTGAPIGRRYARLDEIGVPFGVTVDHTTIAEKDVEDGTVTLRERDSMKQVRIPVRELVGVISGLCSGHLKWEDVVGRYPAQAGQEDAEADAEGAQ